MILSYFGAQKYNHFFYYKTYQCFFLINFNMAKKKRYQLLIFI